MVETARPLDLGGNHPDHVLLRVPGGVPVTTDSVILLGYFGLCAGWALVVYIRRQGWFWPAVILVAGVAGAVALGLIK